MKAKNKKQIYFLLPITLSKLRNKFTKSKYSISAPITDSFLAVSFPSSLSTLASALIFWASHIVSPVKTAMAIRDIAQSSPELFRKMFTTDARIMPSNPKTQIDPTFEQSAFVTVPYIAIMANIPAVKKKAFCIVPI